MDSELFSLVASVPFLDTRERQQLALQNEIWEGELETFLDSLRLRAGDRVLVYDCGLGFDLPKLARRVGPQGEIVAVQANPLWAEECRASAKRLGLRRVRIVLGDLVMDPIPEGLFHLAFCNWQPGKVQPIPLQLRMFLEQARSRLLPKGALAVWEQHWEGTALFPPSPALERVMSVLAASLPDGAPACYRLLGEFTACGFLFEGAWPRQLAHAPGSPVHRWVEQLLSETGARLLEEERLTSTEWEAFQSEWEQRRLDPATLVFSPRALGLLGRCMDAVRL